MISKYHLYVTALVLVFAGCKGPAKTNNPADVKQLKTLLDKNEYFKLDAQFKLLSGNIDESNRLYFKSFIDNAFNRNEKCVKDVDSLFQQTSWYCPIL